jgi:hypothetical protein
MTSVVTKSSVKRYLKVGWGVAGISGAAATIAHYRTLPTTHSYLAEAVETARKCVDPEISETSTFPKAKIFQDFGYAETRLSGNRRLFVEAKKVAETERPLAETSEAEERNWRFYWVNPWEVKFAVIRNFRRVKATVSDLVFPGSADELGNFRWEISRLSVQEPDGEVKYLVGAPVQAIGDENPKSEFSRRRWQLITGGFVLGVAGFFARRRFLQRRLPPSFAELFVRGNPVVERILGKDFRVTAKKGQFGKCLIDGVLELSGTSEAAVKFKAAKVGAVWKILKAEISSPGGRSLSLV